MLLLYFRFSLGADLHGHALSAVIGGEEEHFEDFGESNTSDLLLANHEEGRPGPEGAGDPEPHLHPGSPNRCPQVLSPRYLDYHTHTHTHTHTHQPRQAH